MKKETKKFVCIAPGFGNLEVWEKDEWGWSALFGHCIVADTGNDTIVAAWSTIFCTLSAGPKECGREVLGEL